MNHYDSNGHKVGESIGGIFGDVTHYDTRGHETGHSERGFFGQTNHYDENDHKIGESRPSFWGGSNYYGSGNPLLDISSINEGEMEPEQMGEYMDCNEATEWECNPEDDADECDW